MFVAGAVTNEDATGEFKCLFIIGGNDSREKQPKKETIPFSLFLSLFLVIYFVACNLIFQQHTNTHQQQQKKRKLCVV